MSNELSAAFAVLAAQLSGNLSQTDLVDAILQAYPAKDGESRAQAMCRLQAEADELFEGLIGSVWTEADEA